MSPTEPSPGSSTPSYSCWASAIVRLEENPSLREASCWSVEVVNGGLAERLRSAFLTSATIQSAARERVAASVAEPSSPRTNLFFSPNGYRARNLSFLAPGVRSASRLQYSWVLKASISRSRSTIILSAADCTRPAERPERTLRHRTGDSL